MKTFGFLVFDSKVGLFLALGIGLTVYPTRISFGFTIITIAFWHLIGGIALWARFLILILSLEFIDFDVSRSSLEFYS